MPRPRTLPCALLLLAMMSPSEALQPQQLSGTTRSPHRSLKQQRSAGSRTVTAAIPSTDHDNPNDGIESATETSATMDRRSWFGSMGKASAIAASAAALTASPLTANAEITADSQWPLWPALPVAPYSRRKTIREEIVPNQVWTFDQLIGIYYVQVPIRMTVITVDGGLLVYAPVAPTKECLALLDELIAQHGPVRHIVLPSVAVEHKVNAGPFARQFPNADFYIVDQQYSFPVPLPNRFLGLPSWAKPLPTDVESTRTIFGDSIDFKVLTVTPGPASKYQDVALIHKPSKTLMICDAMFSVTREPPAILTEEPEYTRALLFHARDSKDELVEDTPENRRKGWRRIVLLFNFFFPGSGIADLGIKPILAALSTPTYPYGWGGWMPYQWKSDGIETLDFETYSAEGKPLIYTVVQIILSREPEKLEEWLDYITTEWTFDRVIPAHLNSPVNVGPEGFRGAFSFVDSPPGPNMVRFCDEDVEFLRKAQNTFLSFSVYPSRYGPPQGQQRCGL